MVITIDRFILFVMSNQHTVIAQVITQGVRNLVIQEREQASSGVDQVHFHTQTGENRGVFGTNHARAINDQGAGRVGQIQNGIRVVDTVVTEVHIRR